MAWRGSGAAGSSSEDIFWIDREGIPHWDGREPVKYLKQYRTRAMVEYESYIGTSEAVREKKASFGLRLTRGLSGKAWDVVEPLLDDLAALKVDGGHMLVIAALDRLDKEAVIRKQEKFDDFFKRSWRRNGQEMGDYIREKEHKYNELTRLDKDTRLSDDLYAYFLLEGARLREDQKKLVTMVADNEFETRSFEKTLRTNFHDIHLNERYRRDDGKRDEHTFRASRTSKGRGKGRGRGWYRREMVNIAEDEDEEEYGEEDDDSYPADEDGAEEDHEDAYDVEDDWDAEGDEEEDGELAEAYAAYEQARAALRDQQKRRGFFKATGTLTFEERQAAIRKEKQNTNCGACGQKGHWAGDPECPMKGKVKKGTGKGTGKGKKKGKKTPRRDSAYFVLDDADYHMMEHVNYASQAPPHEHDHAALEEIADLNGVDTDVGPAELRCTLHSMGLIDLEFASERDLDFPESERTEIEVQITVPCPRCKREMVRRQNRATKGWFYGCSHFPDCQGTRSLKDGNGLAAAMPPRSP